MRAKDPNNKALIFTQYGDTIKYLAKKLRLAGFEYRTISGSMPMKQRAAAIEAFQRDPPTTVRTYRCIRLVASASSALAHCRNQGIASVIDLPPAYPATSCAVLATDLHVAAAL